MTAEVTSPADRAQRIRNDLPPTGAHRTGTRARRIGARRIRATAAGLLVAALALTGCAVNEQVFGDATGVAGIVVGGGASSQQAAQAAWVVGFQLANTRATVEYDPAGSGAGREMFIAGGSAFAGSDRAFTLDELATEPFKTCEPGSDIVQLPTYISPIAIAFSLDGIDELRMDAATIARVFTGDITRWNDPAIAEHNPEVDLPDQTITAVHRSDDSGVTENFTEYLHAVAGDHWPHDPSGEWPVDGGEGAHGTSGVATALGTSTGAIGYIDASRATGLGIVSVKVGDQYVPYSAEAAAAVVDQSQPAEGRSDVDLAVELDRTSTADGVYPIVLISYLIGCHDYRDDGDAEMVRAYFEHVVSEQAQAHAAQTAGSAPISPNLRERASAAIAGIR